VQHTTKRMPAVRALAMPADTNPAGDIFGGWILAQMDIAGGIVAVERAEGRVATVAVDSMGFRQPVFVGDVVSVYASVVRAGRTSLEIEVEAWARRARAGDEILVTHGRFTYVAIDEERRPRPLPVERPSQRTAESEHGAAQAPK
jgi:acyl-CoA thioesterase YciA